MTYEDYIARGLAPEQAAMLAGVPVPARSAPIRAAPIDKAELRDMAIDLLAELIHSMQCAPDEFKPTEIIAACKEALDRTEGKPNQSVSIASTTMVTLRTILDEIDGSSAGLPIIDAEFSAN